MGIKVGTVCQVPVTFAWPNAAGEWSASKAATAITKARARRRNGRPAGSMSAYEAILLRRLTLSRCIRLPQDARVAATDDANRRRATRENLEGAGATFKITHDRSLKTTGPN